MGSGLVHHSFTVQQSILYRGMVEFTIVIPKELHGHTNTISRHYSDASKLAKIVRSSLVTDCTVRTSPVVAPHMMVMKVKKVKRPVYKFALALCGERMAPPAIIADNALGVLCYMLV